MGLSSALAKKGITVYLLVYGLDYNTNSRVKDDINIVYANCADDVARIVVENGINVIHFVNNRYCHVKYSVPVIRTAWFYPHDLPKRLKIGLSISQKRYPLISQMGCVRWNTSSYLKDELSYRRADKIFSVTNTLKTQLKSRFHSKVQYVPCPVDTDSFRPVANEDRDSVILLFVGKASHSQKGFRYLYDALRLMSTHLKEKVVLWIVGSIDTADLGKIAEEVCVDYKGLVAHTKLPKIYAESDIFVFPSLYEEFGYVILEAISCGTPVISTNIPSISEMVGDTGILVPPRNPVLLAEAMEKLILNKELRVEISAKSRKRAIEKYSFECVSERAIEEYNDLLDVTGTTQL